MKRLDDTDVLEYRRANVTGKAYASVFERHKE